eukprot:7162106-Pyramimonas_sp.AAC.1
MRGTQARHAQAQRSIPPIRAVRYTNADRGEVTLEQDEHVERLRPVQHPELTGAEAEKKTIDIVAYMFVSLRGVLACALIGAALKES